MREKEPRENGASIAVAIFIAAVAPAVASPILFYIRLTHGVKDEGFMYLSIFFVSLLVGGVHAMVVFLVNSVIIRSFNIRSKIAAMGICACAAIVTLSFAPQIMIGYGKIVSLIPG